MNPTLSARLLARRSDGFFRAHPAAPWDAVLETPVALQTLALVQPNVVEPPLSLPPPQAIGSGVTVSASALGSQAAQAPSVSAASVGVAPAEMSPAPIPAAPHAGPTQDPGPAPELLVLVLMAVVWLLDGWLALRQGLRRCPTAAVTTAAECKAGAVSGTPPLPSQPGMATAGSPPLAPRSRRPAPVLVA